MWREVFDLFNDCENVYDGMTRYKAKWEALNFNSMLEYDDSHSPSQVHNTK